MRRLLLAGLVVAAPPAAAACFSYPDTAQRLQDDIVLTRYDEAASFGAYQTFAVRPDIPLLDGSDAGPPLLDEAAASRLRAAVVQSLVARGYTEVTASEAPDLGVELSVITRINTQQTCFPYYYWGSYWNPWYWGYPGYPYYAPWGCSVSAWRAGTVTVDLLDLRAAAGGQPRVVAEGGVSLLPDGGPLRPLGAVWLGVVYGVLGSATDTNVARAVEGIEQAFAQSPYLTRGPTPAAAVRGESLRGEAVSP
jgi:hypothetical protein